MTPHFLKWSFGPKIESVDGICHQTDSMNRFYLDVKTGPYDPRVFFKKIFLVLYAAYFVVREEGMEWGGKTLMEE